jgi:NAD(P)H-dependent FMN reductase
MERTPVLAICGSLRERSLHRALLTAVERRSPELLLIGAELVRDLPLLDPDLDTPDRLPSVVREFRLLAESARGGIVSSPEYVHAASGVSRCC